MSLKRKFLVISATAIMAWLACAAAAAAADSSLLASIVAGAKKEETVSATLHGGLAGKGIERLKRGVAERYGVNLQISYVPVISYPQNLAKAIFEHQAGAPPSFDLLTFADAILSKAVSAGIAEKVDWKPLLAPGTPPQVIQLDSYALSVHTDHVGLAWNPAVISAPDAPKTLQDLANPRWRGKIMLFPYTSLYLGYALVLGVDQTLGVLRQIMKNDPTVEVFSRGLTRYLAGEYPLLLTASGFYADIKKKGRPVQWSSLDVSLWTTHSVMVAKGARHPNAAKLVALYLASPEGHQLMLEEANAGSLFYPGNLEQEINQDDRRRGLKVYNPLEWPGSLDFILSPKGAQVEQEIGRILRSR